MTRCESGFQRENVVPVSEGNRNAHTAWALTAQGTITVNDGGGGCRSSVPATGREANKGEASGNTSASAAATSGRPNRSNRSFRPCGSCAPRSRCRLLYDLERILGWPLFDFRVYFCHSAPMDTHAFGFRLRANFPEGQKRFPISRSKFARRAASPPGAFPFPDSPGGHDER
jgi:hypothetical protein